MGELPPGMLKVCRQRIFQPLCHINLSVRCGKVSSVWKSWDHRTYVKERIRKSGN